MAWDRLEQALRRVDEETLGANAVLARGTPAGAGGDVDNGVDLGARQEDEGVFAAELEDDGCEGIGRLAHDELAHLGRADEGHQVDLRCECEWWLRGRFAAAPTDLTR